MPFDQANFNTEPLQLRMLRALREHHSDPKRWNCAGMGSSATTESSGCIIVGCWSAFYRVFGRAASWVDVLGTSPFEFVKKYLVAALPKGVFDVVRFNERTGTTHAQLMEYYDRAIALAEADLLVPA